MSMLVVALVFFVGICSSILRKKLFKKIIGLFVSLNSLFVFSILLARRTGNQELESFSFVFLIFSSLIFVVGFLSCHYAKTVE